ncbi:MAG TPA: LL-diaminopimelate aminotransferase [Bacillales bacterium]
MSYQSKRVANIPPYLFAKINKRKMELVKSGMDVINLGIGDPDLPTPIPIVDKMVEEMRDPSNFKYSSYGGISEYREAVADYYHKKYHVELDPETEVLTLIGSKEGIANIVPAVIDPGDYVLSPDPSYAVYRVATQLAGGRVHDMPLTKENQFLPNFAVIPEEVLQQARLMFLNYPGNPTAATVDLDFFRRVIQFAKQYDIPVAHDFAYSRITFDDYQAPSILQVEGAKDGAVEFGSLSKTYNMTGWRIGYVVGNHQIIEALSVVKNNTDTSQFLPIQKAAAFALANDQMSPGITDVYQERMIKIVDGLYTIGIRAERPKGSFFVWAQVPDGYTSCEFAEIILERAGVVVTPGSAFGPSGEGYFRISLTVPVDRLHEAVERIKKYIH